MTEQDALDFVRVSLGSIWALELLALLGREPERSWPLDRIIHESRSSSRAVNQAIVLLERAGLVAMTAPHEYRYQPVNPDLDAIGELVQKIYATKPSTIIAAIFESPNEQLRTFADAFKFKE